VLGACGRVVGEELEAVDGGGLELTAHRREERVQVEDRGVEQDEAVGGGVFVGEGGVEDVELGLVLEEGGREVSGGVLP
jgi:hypothetical protein